LNVKQWNVIVTALIQEREIAEDNIKKHNQHLKKKAQ
jgi:hypothetical protein